MVGFLFIGFPSGMTIPANQVFHVSESATLGTHFGTVVVTDPDVATGQRLFYTLPNSTNLFDHASTISSRSAQ